MPTRQSGLFGHVKGGNTCGFRKPIGCWEKLPCRVASDENGGNGPDALVPVRRRALSMSCKGVGKEARHMRAREGGEAFLVTGNTRAGIASGLWQLPVQEQKRAANRLFSSRLLPGSDAAKMCRRTGPTGRPQKSEPQSGSCKSEMKWLLRVPTDASSSRCCVARPKCEGEAAKTSAGRRGKTEHVH